MKKIVSLVLCLAILASFGVPVFATEDEFFEIDTMIEEVPGEELEEIVIEEELPEDDSDTVEAFAVVKSGTCGANGDNLTWVLDDEGTLTISGTGAMEDYGYLVAPWYSSRSSIKKVVIESGVTSIGNYAFEYCDGLTSIEIPASVTSIGVRAFYGTAYYDDADNWEDGVLYIGNHLIEARPSLLVGTYKIKDGTMTIADRAFKACEGLATITIPSSVTSIGDGAFEKCRYLIEININKDNKNYSSEAGVLFNKDKSTLVAYPGCGAIYEIPSSVTSIGERAFYDCTGLTSIEIPASVTSICDRAFYNCTGLTSVTFEKDSELKSIGEYAFNDCYGLKSIEIPASVTQIGSSAFRYCDELAKATIYSKSATIGSDNFKNCHSDMTLYGYAGSTTETYAKNNNIPFVAIEEEIATYTVTYNANGGTNAPESQTKTEGVALTLSSTVPTRSGYKFLGWATTKDGAVAYAPGASYTVDVNVTLYAVWEKENVVTPDSPAIIVVDTKGRAGSTVYVDINVKNNPGVALVGFNVNYDSEVMTLKSAKLGEIFTGELDCNLSPVPFVFNVYTGSDNKSNDGILVTLEFVIATDCPEGEYEITLTNPETINIDEEYVYFTIENGKVTIKHAIPGAVNGDGEVTRMDLLRLAKYFSGYDVILGA